MLVVRELAFCYAASDRPALDGVSFDVERGQIVGLLGPNGAGKTTLISHLAGVLPLQQGQINIDSEPLARQRLRRPGRIAIAPQEYAFYPTLSVVENVRCFAALAGADTARQDEALGFTQLQSFAATRADRLSGGLKRRLNLAIAMLSAPDYLLLDEPTVGVDPQSRSFLLEAVRELARRGTGIVYTSHYMDEVQQIADRVVILDHGRILRQGTLDELLAQEQPVLKLAQLGLAAQALAQLLQPFAHPLDEVGCWQMFPGVTPTSALAAIEQAGATILHAEFGRFDLEQLFMQLTHRSLRDAA